MPRPKGRDLAKERYWRRMLRQWRGSGLTGRDFCGEHGLSEPSFYAWRRQIGRRDQERAAARARQPQTERTAEGAAEPAFLKVKIGAGASALSAIEAPAIEVLVAPGRVLRVRSGFDAELLRQLVRLLEEPLC
jgi:transposase